MKWPALLWSVAFALSTGFTSSAQTLSTSKLSAHLINGYTVGGSNIIVGNPRVLKVLGLDSGFPSGMAQALRDYKGRVPTGKSVVRIYSPKTYTLSDDATASAGDFWTNILQHGLSYLAPADRALIDYLEGPNEGQTPTLGYPNATAQQALQASQWFNQFWTNLTPRMVAAGYKPCPGSIAVGNPGGSQAEAQSYLAAFVPALRQAKAAGGAWSYHAYTIGYTTDPAVEYWYSLRYRQFYSYFASAFPDLNTMPMLLTEGGVDDTGNGAASGWQARGSASDYQHWLNWFDQQLQQDSYVLGCTLFEVGNPEAWGWPSFDLEPIAAWMKTYLLPPTSVPPAPTGLAATAGNGSVTLAWTHPPLNPTSWSVKRATNSGGLYFTLAAGLTVGVQATTYTDTAVNNFTPYYYVVTAMNAVGESDASAPVAATPGGPVPTAMNCGGGALGSFLPDMYYDAGLAYSTGTVIATNGIVNPAPMTVYQSQRYGNLTYTLPYLAPSSAYKVRLHFAEIYWTAPGQRLFHVLLNGAQVLTNFDIFQAAGGGYQANVQEFNAISDKNGLLTVQLVNGVDNASINGLEVTPNPGSAKPAAPANLSATLGSALVTLAWSVPAGATSFAVKRSTTSGANYSVIASNLTQATYRDPSFTPNTTYYYVVSASNAFGEGPLSAQASARPTTGLPELVVTAVNWTPANLFTGTHAVFSATVLNRGSAPTPAGTVLGVGFNVDGAGTASWEGNYTAALAANAAVTLTADGGPTGNYWTGTPGPHTVVATVDDVNRITESIEDNNGTTVPFTVYTTGYSRNSGGPATGSFAADANFAGSANTSTVTNAINVSGIANAAPQLVYQTERWGEFAYLLSNLVPGSNYTVRLHFAEISSSVNQAGDRRFNVLLNGIQALTDLDVLAAAGAKYRALTRDIKKRADSSGTLLVQFLRGSANEPKCSGLEVFGSAPPAQPPLFTGITAANGLAILTWQTTPAALYQVQYKDELTATNWFACGNPLLASGATLSLTNDAAGLSHRFYRIAQIP